MLKFTKTRLDRSSYYMMAYVVVPLISFFVTGLVYLLVHQQLGLPAPGFLVNDDNYQKVIASAPTQKPVNKIDTSTLEERITPLGQIRVEGKDGQVNTFYNVPTPEDKKSVVDIPTPTSNQSPQPEVIVEAPKPEQGSDLVNGEEVYNAGCMGCHSSGVLGAPKSLVASDWTERLNEKGLDGLTDTAISGINAMPPRGACATCSDDDLKDAIAYMTSENETTPKEVPQPEAKEVIVEVPVTEVIVEAPKPEQGSDLVNGEEVYNAGCMGCHSSGVLGAPKSLVASDWTERLNEKGLDGLTDTAISGINAMPPRGACVTCSDDDLKDAIAYMTSENETTPKEVPQPEAKEVIVEVPVTEVIVEAPKPEQGSDLVNGEEVYNAGCMGCHSSGVLGAPKSLVASDWTERLNEKGLDGLTDTAISGINAMPPRGACATCSDDDLKDAIAYMTSENETTPKEVPQPEAKEVIVEVPVTEVIVEAPKPEQGSDLVNGEEVYNAGCMGCHSSGVLGAPKSLVASDWTERLNEKGLGGLTDTAISGINAMPPRGACATCSDDDLKDAIAYMTSGD